MSDTTDRLRKIAQAATAGPWEVDSDYDGDRGDFHSLLAASGQFLCEYAGSDPADAEHIATFDPQLVAAMLEVIESSEGDHWPADDGGGRREVCYSCRGDAADERVPWPCLTEVALDRFREVAGE